jgi:hypothetical protein
MQDLSLPPSITLKPNAYDVRVLTRGGICVEVSLPRPRGLDERLDAEALDRARGQARDALIKALESLRA